jgi:hypothetical protein
MENRRLLTMDEDEVLADASKSWSEIARKVNAG